MTLGPNRLSEEQGSCSRTFSVDPVRPVSLATLLVSGGPPLPRTIRQHVGRPATRRISGKNPCTRSEVARTASRPNPVFALPHADPRGCGVLLRVRSSREAHQDSAESAPRRSLESHDVSSLRASDGTWLPASDGRNRGPGPRYSGPGAAHVLSKPRGRATDRGGEGRDRPAGLADQTRATSGSGSGMVSVPIVPHLALSGFDHLTVTE